VPRTAAAARLVEREWGKPGSPALCFWHAPEGATSAAALGEVARVLAGDYGFHVVSSRVPPGERGPAGLVRAGLGMLDALGLERAVASGYGSGAALACHAAAAAPERVSALVLLEGGHVDDGQLRPSETYRDLDEAGIRVLLLTATEPAGLAAANEPWIARFRAALPDADVQRMPGWGHDLVGDGGSVLAHVIGGWLSEA
jgi:pimeloyl-ACP methyl ester carboxylesterase